MRNKTPEDQRADSEATHWAQEALCHCLRGAADGTRPCPWTTSSAPSDAYKIPKKLKTSGQPLFSTEDIPTRHHLKP